MTLLNLLILAHGEKLRLLETQTWGTSNRERSYSLKGKGTTDAMFHLFGHPNPLFFLQYQMADNSPQQTRSPVWFLEHMNYKIQFVRFLDIVGWITLLFKNLVMTNLGSQNARYQCFSVDCYAFLCMLVCQLLIAWTVAWILCNQFSLWQLCMTKLLVTKYLLILAPHLMLRFTVRVDTVSVQTNIFSSFWIKLKKYHILHFPICSDRLLRTLNLCEIQITSAITTANFTKWNWTQSNAGQASPILHQIW